LGLSVIELLAAIANITILAAMLLPALTTAKEGDHRTAGPPDFEPIGLPLTMCTDCSENHLPT
jgi:hypothetical protein